MVQFQNNTSKVYKTIRINMEYMLTNCKIEKKIHAQELSFQSMLIQQCSSQTNYCRLISTQFLARQCFAYRVALFLIVLTIVSFCHYIQINKQRTRVSKVLACNNYKRYIFL